MRNKKIPLKCIQCNSITFIKLSRAKKAKFCSDKCRVKGMLNHRPYNWKGGFMKHKGYRMILLKSHPGADRDGYVYEHRVVFEKHIGRFLEKKEVIHHKNANRSDNRIENLELKSSQSEHMKEHYPKGKHIYIGVHPWLGKKHTEESKLKMQITKAKH